MLINQLRNIITIFFALSVASCIAHANENAAAPQIDYSSFSTPQKVNIYGLPSGYEGTPISIEEPFVSRDGHFLFFNSNEHENNKDLHYAELSKNHWIYRGEIGPNINRRKEVDANPTMDSNYNFYYIASETKSFVITGKFDPHTGQLTNVREIKGVPEIEPKLLKLQINTNMGIEISKDGNTAYFSRATFNLIGIRIITSDILFSERIGGNLVYRKEHAKRIMANINTDDLEYAASISNDGLTLYFTRLMDADLKSGNIRSKIMYSTRNNTSEPFGLPVMIGSIGSQDFVEGPSITGDGKEIYYHKREGKKFGLYKVKRNY